MTSVIAACGGCGSKKNVSTDKAEAAAPASEKSGGTATEPAKFIVGFDATRSFGNCVANDHGVFVDVGTSEAEGREKVMREGESWARIQPRQIDLPFFATASEAEVPLDHLSLRVHFLAAKGIEATLNGRRIGRTPSKSNDIVTIPLATDDMRLRPGANHLVLHFTGAPKIHADALGELAWVHLGTSPAEANYRAPTETYLRGERTIDGVPRRTIHLRNGATIRCTTWAPRGARLQFETSASSGEGDLAIKVHSDRRGTKNVATVPVRLPATNKQDIALGNDSDEAVSFEFGATSSGTGRVAIVEPIIGVPAPESPPKTPSVKNAVIVILGFTDPHALRSYGGALSLPNIESLATTGTLFENHFATTNVANGSVASVLAGRPASELRMTDGGSRIGDSVVTLSVATGPAGFVNGYFTANPTTFSNFGFARGFTDRSEIGLGEPATVVFDRAANFVRGAKGKRFLAVVHARGAHPPWDVTATDLKVLAPPDYAGAIDPRHAGDTLARARHIPPLLRLTDADRTRTSALLRQSLEAHDRALGLLLEAIRETDPETLIVVTSDVGPNASLVSPFAEGGALNEGARRIPLILHWPNGTPRHDALPSMDYDVTRTVLEALGFSTPPTFIGEDLAKGAFSRLFRPIVAASRDRRLVEQGTFVLEERRNLVRLCDLAIDPDCLTDLSSSHPVTLELLTARRRAEPKTDVKRDAAVIGAKEALDLLSWGHDEP